MRGLLLGIITLGAVTTGVGLTGVVAATTDVAKTGTVTKERAETGVFPVQVDLKLARPGLSGVCGVYTDDLITGIFSINSGSARAFDRTELLCVKNVGATAKPFRLDTSTWSHQTPPAVRMRGSAAGSRSSRRIFPLRRTQGLLLPVPI